MSPYDPDTLAKLTARHGPDRALAIALGQDAATNADIAAWRALGPRKRPAKVHDRADEIMTRIANGETAGHIAQSFGGHMTKAEVLRIVAAHR